MFGELKEAKRARNSIVDDDLGSKSRVAQKTGNRSSQRTVDDEFDALLTELSQQSRTNITNTNQRSAALPQTDELKDIFDELEQRQRPKTTNTSQPSTVAQTDEDKNGIGVPEQQQGASNTANKRSTVQLQSATSDLADEIDALLNDIENNSGSIHKPTPTQAKTNISSSQHVASGFSEPTSASYVGTNRFGDGSAFGGLSFWSELKERHETNASVSPISAADGSSSNRVYVRNLSVTTKLKDIKNHFRMCGDILYVFTAHHILIVC